MAVRSRRLFGPVALSPTDTWITLYTVPAGRTAIVKTFALINWSSAARVLDLAINVTSTGRIQHAYPLAALQTYVWPGLIVLNPGDVLMARSSGGATVNAYGAGTLLSGAPS